MRRSAAVLPVLFLFLSATCSGAGFKVALGKGPAHPGDVVRVEVSGAEEGAEFSCLFSTKTVPLYPLGPGRLRGLIGLTAQTPPGDYPLTVTRKLPSQPDVTVNAKVHVVPRKFTSQRLRMSKEATSLIEDPEAEAALKVIRAALAQETPDQRWKGRFALPARGRRSSRYGHARMINKDTVWSWHKGIDIAAPAGRPVRAPNAGKVVLAGQYPLQGRMILLDHGQGVMSVYMHLKEIKVQLGQEVSKGGVIAAVGSTGFSTGAHLHWGIYVHGDSVDPVAWTKTTY